MELRWTRADDELPREDTEVLATVVNEAGRSVWPDVIYKDDQWLWLSQPEYGYYAPVEGEVTHWMPLPPPAQN